MLETLRNSEDRLRTVVSDAPIIVFALDRDGVFTVSEGKGLEKLGYRPGEAVGQSIFELCQDAPEIMDNFRRALAGETFSTVVDVGELVFETWYGPLRDHNGEIAGVMGFATDITDRSRALEKLRFRVELEHLVAAISTRFIRLGPDEVDSGINFALKATGELAGVDRSYVFLFSQDGKRTSNTHEWCADGIEPQIQNLQDQPLDLVPWWMQKLERHENIHIPRVADLPAEAEAEKQVLQAQSIQSLAAVPMVSSRGLIGFIGFDSVRAEKVWTDGDFALLQTLSNVLVSALERKEAEETRTRLEEQFRQAQKMEAVGRLAGGIAHDFNNILTVIMGCCGVWLGHLGRGHPVREDIEKIQVSAERAASLTHQLLAFSRRQATRQQTLDLNEVVRNLSEILRRLMGENTELRTRLAPEPSLVKADPGQIEQVLMNLMVNACDAMPQGGELTIETSNFDIGAACGDMPPGPYVMLVVRDTGCGMDAETQAHIFEPFFTTKEPGQGTGLGLSTVYGIVRQAGGHTSAYSEPGRGATFRIYLPRDKEGVPEVRAIEPEETPPGGDETVLVVEDEPEVRNLIRAVLQASGYRVMEARRAAEALSICEKRTEPIDLLLADVVMPEMNGSELAGHLRSSFPGMKVLFMSGYTGEILTRDGLSEQEAPFLQKPFTPDVLKRKIREILDTGEKLTNHGP